MENKYKDIQPLLFLVIIIAAISLRTPMTTVGTLLFEISEELSLTDTVAGMITTVPIIVMAVFSPFVSKISSKIGIGESLSLGMLILFFGIILRNTAGVAGLLFGTAVIGVGITFGNVLIPAMVAKYFKESAGVLTGVYTTTMSIASGIGAAISVPMSIGMGLGWRLTFGLWAATSLVSVFVTLFFVKRDRQREQRVKSLRNETDIYVAEDTAKLAETLNNKADEMGKIYKNGNTEAAPLFRNSVAWWLAIFFGAQSCVFYTMAAWLPTIVMDMGLSAEEAGLVASVFQVSAIPANFGTPMLAHRTRRYKAIGLATSCLGAFGVAAVAYAHGVGQICIGTAMLSMGVGGVFSLTLVMFGVKARNTANSVRLSGFAQSVGYIMAAIGPIYAGILHDKTGNWDMVMLSATCLMLLSAFAGLMNGSDKKI